MKRLKTVLGSTWFKAMCGFNLCNGKMSWLTLHCQHHIVKPDIIVINKAYHAEFEFIQAKRHCHGTAPS